MHISTKCEGNAVHYEKSFVAVIRAWLRTATL